MSEERSADKCPSCRGRGVKLRSSRRLHVIGEVERGVVPVRVCVCLDCAGSGLAEVEAA